jgi:hypothetical protein
MSVPRCFWAMAVAAALTAATASQVQAQVLVAPAPVVSFYQPAIPVTPVAAVSPPVAFYPAPAVSYYYAPVVSAAPAPVVVSAPAVSYYMPVRVSRGLFGRTVVRTPFSTTRF